MIAPLIILITKSAFHCGASAKEMMFPVAHMKTAGEFSEVLMIALSKRQSFGKA